MRGTSFCLRLALLALGVSLATGCGNTSPAESTRAKSPPKVVSKAPDVQTPWWQAEYQHLSRGPFGKSPASIEEAQEKLDWLTEPAEAPPSVEGDCVGGGATPGRFYLMALAFLAKGTPEDFVRMAGSNKLPVRLMGLWCLTQADPRAAVPLLKQRLAGREELTVFPGGCCGSTITEGEWAMRLLRNRHYMRMMPPAQPLLPPDELATLDRQRRGTP